MKKASARAVKGKAAGKASKRKPRSYKGRYLSEISFPLGGIGSGSILGVALYLFLLAVIFGAFLYHAGRMIFGEPAPSAEPSGEGNKVGAALMAALLLAVLALGLYIPAFLNDVLQQIVDLFLGGGA